MKKKKIIIISAISFLLLSIIYFNFILHRNYFMDYFLPSFSCSKSGEQIGSFGMPKKCCDGLKAISSAWGGYQGECPPPLTWGGLGTCTPCGDNFCNTENGENKCNCQEDCTGEEKSCINYPRVMNIEDSGKCCPGLKEIVIGHFEDDCSIKAENILRKECFPCGDGYCAKQYLENKCNCPEDCK